MVCWGVRRCGWVRLEGYYRKFIDHSYSHNVTLHLMLSFIPSNLTLPFSILIYLTLPYLTSPHLRFTSPYVTILTFYSPPLSCPLQTYLTYLTFPCLISPNLIQLNLASPETHLTFPYHTQHFTHLLPLPFPCRSLPRQEKHEQ